jgi:hypothetical protein
MSAPRVAESEKKGSESYLGRFHSRHGSYGTIDVAARLEGTVASPLENPERLFPRRGQVEIHGVIVTKLSAGDWIRFDAAVNTRPRGPDFKAVRWSWLARVAATDPLSSEEARVLLSRTGWRGSEVAGRWAFRLSDGRAVVVSLRRERDGMLRMPRHSLASVAVHPLDDERLLRPSENDHPLYEIADDEASELLDWSEQADHIAHVVRALGGFGDARLDEIIAWLELHADPTTGRVSATGAEHGPALDAARSGELARRLRADRDLMAEYLAAARSDPLVAAAIEEAARDGLEEERRALRADLDGELQQSRAAAVETLEQEIADLRAKLGTALDDELAEIRQESAQRIEQEREAAHAALSADLADRERAAVAKLEEALATRRRELEEEIARGSERVADLESEEETARARLAAANSEIAELEGRADTLRGDLDRLSAASAHQARSPSALPPGRPAPPPMPAPTGLVVRDEVCAAVRRQILLSESGRELMLELLSLMLAGEIPILTGPDVDDFLLVAGRLAAPARTAVLEADPMLVSYEDLWARPGSGAATVFASAAAAADRDGAATLAVIRGIERSGARFWYPTLRQSVGLLPRPLLICATVVNAESEEIAALPADSCSLTIDGALANGAYLAAPGVLGPESAGAGLDPGSAPADYRQAAAELPDFSPDLSISQALRAARVFAESLAFTGDQAIAQKFARTFAASIGRSAPFTPD